MLSLKRCLLFCGWLLACVVGAGQQSTPPGPESVARWIGDLDHDEYRVRKQATQALAENGAGVLPSLIEAVKSGSLERRLRIVDLLGRIYSRGDESTFEPAELALEDIKHESAGSLSDHAKVVLASHYEIRERLAVAAIQKLGGSALYATKSQMLELGDPEEDEDEEKPTRVLNAVFIGTDWTGGDEGLRHVRRLTRLPILYWVKKAAVSEDAIKELAADMRNLNIQQRGPAYLGIAPMLSNRGCGIQRVQPNSAAAKAGVRQHDIITQFDGQPVEDFEKLLEVISEKLPGQEVALTVERNGETLELTAELTGWPKEVGP